MEDTNFNPKMLYFDQFRKHPNTMKDKANVITKHNIDVKSFSIIPVQSGIEVDTPDGRGTYEGITSSGIVTVFIDGGMRQYSWHEVVPDITLTQMVLIDELRTNLIEHIFRTKILPSVGILVHNRIYRSMAPEERSYNSRTSRTIQSLYLKHGEKLNF